MNYFENFPLSYYSFGTDEAPVVFQNLTTYLDLIDQIKDQTSFYEVHNIIDGERADTLAHKLYGDSRYYWTFFLMNEKLRRSGWPLSEQNLRAVAAQNYPHWTITTQVNISASDFIPGNKIRGNASGTTGTIVEVNLELGQLVVDTTGYETRRSADFLSGMPFFTLQQEVGTGFYYIDLADIPIWQADYSVNFVAGVYASDPAIDVLSPPSNLVNNFELRGDKLYLKVDVSPYTVLLFVDYFYRFYTNRNFNPTENVTLIDVDTPEIASVQLIGAVAQYNSVHHYEDTDNEYVDIDPLNRNVSGLIPITHMDRMIETNTNLRQIRIIKPDAIDQVLSEFKKFLRN